MGDVGQMLETDNFKMRSLFPRDPLG